jgi:hypothetical protein
MHLPHDSREVSRLGQETQMHSRRFGRRRLSRPHTAAVIAGDFTPVIAHRAFAAPVAPIAPVPPLPAVRAFTVVALPAAVGTPVAVAARRPVASGAPVEFVRLRRLPRPRGNEVQFQFKFRRNGLNRLDRFRVLRGSGFWSIRHIDLTT